MLTEDPVISSLVNQYKTNKIELQTTTAKYKETEENITKMSDELNKITEELEQVKVYIFI